MAYEKNTWARGDVVTSDKLNHIEQGIAGLLVSMSMDVSSDGKTFTLPKTWQEINDLISNGVPCYGFATEMVDGSPVHSMTMFVSTGIDSSGGSPVYYVNDSMSSFNTDDPSGYPSFTMMA